MQIADDTVITVFKNRRIRILVDSHNSGGFNDSFQVLFCAGDAAGNVKISRKLLTGHADIAVHRHIFECLRNRPRRADRRACSAGETFDELHVFPLSDAAARRNHTRRLRDRRIDRNSYAEIVILLQSVRECLHLRACISVTENNTLPDSGNRRRFLDFSTGAFVVRLADLAEYIRADDDTHNLVCAFINCCDFRVAISLLYMHAFEETAAAEDLQRVIADFKRRIGRVHLRHRGILTVAQMVFFHLGCGVVEHSCRFQLSCHVRELEADALIDADRIVKLHPFLRISKRVFIRALRNAKSLRSDSDPTAVERGHRDFEALAFLAQKVFLRHLHVVERKRACARRSDSHLVVVFAGREAFPTFLDNERADAFCADFRCRYRKYNINIRLRCIRDKNLSAVQQVIVALVNRCRFGAACVRSRVFFGKSECAKLFSLTKRNHVFAFLLFRAEGRDRVGSKRRMRRQNNADPAIHSGQLFYRDCVADDIQPRAAVFLRIGDAHPAVLPKLSNDLIRKGVRLIKLKRNRLDFRFRESTDLRPQFLVFLCGLK